MSEPIYEFMTVFGVFYVVKHGLNNSLLENFKVDVGWP